MVDIALSARTRINGGARVEHFDQTVTTFDPFGLFVRTIEAESQEHRRVPGHQRGARRSRATRTCASATARPSTARSSASWRRSSSPTWSAAAPPAAIPNLQRALIQNVDARWEMFPGGRSIFATSVFFKHFDKPIERVVIAGAQPIATFQNADSARNFGVELEAAYDLGRGFFVNANYTFVDSEITLLPEQQSVQTSLVRPLAGQSKNLFNLTAEYALQRVLGPRAGELCRRPHLGRRRQPGARHRRRRTRDGRPGVHAAVGLALQLPRQRREPDRQRIPVHAGQRDDSARSSSAGPSASRSASTCSRRDFHRERTRRS